MPIHTARRILTLAASAVTLALAANAHAVDFAPPKTLTTDLNPTAMATGDLNNDGVPDLVTANFTGGNVSVMLGTTDNLGNFGAATNIDVGNSVTATDRKPWSVAIGNVVGDSNLDIVVAVSGEDEVTILQGDGTGTTFSTVFHEATGNDPRSVALEDVDLNGTLDIVAANMNVDNAASYSVTVLLNDLGADTFTEAAGSPFAAGLQPFGVVVADATGDTIADVVVTNFTASTVSILTGAGDGTFGAPAATAVGAAPYAVAVADLDGANGPDLVVTNSSTGVNSISVLLSDGIGGFVKTDTTVGSRPRGVAVADISGTSDLDIIVANSASNDVSILEGDGTGVFPSVTSTFAAGTNPRPLVVDDFDGDTFLDIAVSEPNAAAGNATVLINDNSPVASDDAFDVINGSTSIALDVLANDSDPDSGDTLTITAVGAASGSGTVSINGTNDGLIYGNSVDSDTTETFTYTAEDQFGYAATATVTITLGANQAPSFSSTAVTAGTQDALYTYNITATDPDTGDSLVITAPTLPGWLNLTDNGDGTATLSGTPLNANVGANAVSLLVTDAGTLTGSQPFTITVVNVNDAPSFTSSPVTTATEDVAYSYSITSTDPDVGDTLAITAPTIPTWLTLTDNNDGTATLSGTPTNANVGPHSVDLLVTDSGTGNLTDTQSFTVTVGNVNDPPTAVGTIAPQSATELTAFGPLDVSGNFVDPDSALAYSISGLPAGTGLSINSGSAVISGTPTDADAQASPISVTVSATDGSTPATQPFTLTVTDINQAPSITSTAVTAATQDAAYSYSITSTDADASDTHAITATTLPSWLTLTDNGDGTATLSGTPLNADVGANPVVLVVTDSGAGSLTDSESFTITVANVNDAPVVTSGGIILFQDATGTVQVNATDVDAGDTLSYAVTQQPTTVGGSASVDSSGLVTYDATGATAGSDSIEVTVTDSGAPVESTAVTIPLTVNATGETDSNGDGVTDAQAIAAGLDPLDADGDTDGDGISDANEIGDPAAPADADNDGVIDALEVGATAADASTANGLLLSSGDTVEIISSGETLSNVVAGEATGGPAGIRFPFGTVSYTTTAPVGGSVTVRMVFSADLPTTPVLYKVDGAGTFTELASGLWTKVDTRTIDVTLTDGDPATDLDGDATNGSIDDPIAVGTATTIRRSSSGGGGCTLVSASDGKQDPLMPLMMLVAVAYLYRRKRHAG